MTELKLTDILPQLAAWFPPEVHKERKLPGGGKWYFVPHQCVRDRLNEICPGDWHDEYKGPFLSGNETVMICKLTICGVSREGIADSKTFPELNDEGKEKIIGSPVINATRHAFRDAAEQFGIGAYLDLQKSKREKFVGYMRSRHDGRAYKAAYDNGWVGGDTVQAQQKQEEKPSKPLTLVPPSPKPQPVVNQKPQSMYPQHNATVKRVRELTGHEPQEVINQCKVVSQGQRDRPDQLSPVELERLLESLVLGWCSGHFPSVDHARTAYRGKVETLTASGAGIEDAIASFIESVKVAPVK